MGVVLGGKGPDQDGVGTSVQCHHDCRRLLRKMMLNDELENYDYSLSLELGNCMLALDSDTDQGLCAGNVCSVVDVRSRE